MLAVSSSAFEITAVSDDAGTVWIIEDLCEDLPSILFAVDRDTYAETTAQLQEYSILKEDYQKLKAAAGVLQNANTTLWQENRDLEDSLRWQKRMKWIAAGGCLFLGIMGTLVLQGALK